MISEVVMPQMGADMTEGTLVKWLKNEGDRVDRGEIIAEIETDKANVEIEAFESGVFRKAIASEGDVIEVGGLIGVIAAADEDISKYENGAAPSVGAPPSPGRPSPSNSEPQTPANSKETVNLPADPAPSPSEAAMETGAGAEAAAEKGSPAQPVATAPPRVESSRSDDRSSSGRVRISPVARRIAEERNVDVRTVRGTGPDGRIIKRDIEAATTSEGARRSAPAAAPPTGDRRPTAVTPSKMRQAIARRMSQSKREAPHYYLLLDIDMTSALETRAQYNDALAAGDVTAAPDTKASINDVLVRAAALALKKHPEFNATIDESGTVTEHPQQNICIGIALDDGLIAPAILDAGAKPLAQIAADAKDLIERAKNGKMRPAEINDGTFTITNLGAYGVETLIGIIQPPQTAILGAGSVMPQPAVRDGQVTVRQMMKVALSADHRATDGAQGAQFLAELKRLLENPLLLVV